MADEPTGSGLIDPRPRVLTDGLPAVGRLAFGCWRLTTSSTSEAREAVETALELGMNLIDNADVYGFDWGGAGFGANEERLGAVLREAPSLRDRMVLATKGGIVPGVPYDSSPKHLRRACEGSLRRLGVDSVDIWMVHRPDPFTSPAAVAEGLMALHHEGKVATVGISNHTAAQHGALVAHLELPLATHQLELSAAHLHALWDGTLDRCLRDGVTPMAWSPLAGGRLASGDDVPPDLVAALDRLAEREGVDRATVATAFVLAHPSRPVTVVGTQRPDRLRALAAATGVHLDRADVYGIVQASLGQALP
jgi:predicted oxidoreductase